jgi:DNA-binding protein
LSDTKKSKDAEDILSEFHGAHTSESEPQLPSPESEPQLPSPESEPQLPSPESEPQLPSPEARYDPEERNVIFVGTKPIMTYVSATLTQLSTRQTVTIKARGKRITQAVDVSQMIVKRMNTVGYVISDVRILSDSLTSQDGKTRNVSTIEIDITKN